MAAASGIYVARMNAVANSTAVTILQITNSASGALKVLRVAASQHTSTSSAQNILTLLRKSVAATMPTTTTPDPIQVGMAASGVTCKTGVATVEGTDTNLIHKEAWNILNGMLWIPTPDEQPIVPPSGIIALKWEVAPTSATYTVELTYQEIG